MNPREPKSDGNTIFSYNNNNNAPLGHWQKNPQNKNFYVSSRNLKEKALIVKRKSF